MYENRHYYIQPVHTSLVGARLGTGFCLYVVSFGCLFGWLVYITSSFLRGPVAALCCFCCFCFVFIVVVFVVVVDGNNATVVICYCTCSLCGDEGFCWWWYF